MSHEEDDVGFDLTAWEAPPPSRDLADQVIARVRSPEPAAAVEPASARTSRWVIGGSIVAAVVVGAVSVGLALRGDDHLTSSGAVATAKPSHLELGGTSVDLEAETDVWWMLDGKRVIAMQPRGMATWRVAPGHELVIDAGATGASVKASGASLRVEVDMNLDAKTIGTSAVTAAAVALVTVVVYEGVVHVTGSEKSVAVAAGTTVEIAPNKAPAEPALVASGAEKRLRAEIEFLKLEVDWLRKRAAIAPIARPGDDPPAPRVPAPRSPSDRDDDTLSRPSPPRTVDSTPAGCDAVELDPVEMRAANAYSAGNYAQAMGLYESLLRCRPLLAPKAFIAACRARNFPKAKKFFVAAGSKEVLAQVCLKEGFDPRR